MYATETGGKTYEGKQLSGEIYESRPENSKQVRFGSTRWLFSLLDSYDPITHLT